METETKKRKKVVICIPTIVKPFQQCLDALEASVPLLDAAGIDHYTAWSVGSPYISHARAQMVTKCLNACADIVVFIDHDMSWRPEDLLKLIETEGDFVSGAYRFKDDNEESYMGALLPDIHGMPQVRADGCVKAHCTPAGFLKMTRYGISKLMLFYPELNYISNGTLTPDLFQHGVHKGVWLGEDYSLCRRWLEMGEEIWVIPDMNIDHYNSEGRCWPGNYHSYLLRQPGGSEWKGEEC